MSLREIRSYLEGRGRSGEAVGVATLLAAWRSAPRAPGARFAAGAGPSTAGSISAGCVEADLREHLTEVAAGASARLVRYGISDDDAAAVGLACGGEIEVLARAHDPDDPVWLAARRALEGGEEVVLVQGAGGDALGRWLLREADGTLVGSLGTEELDTLASRVAEAALEARHRPAVREAAPGVRLFVEPILRPGRLFAVGATPVAIALSRLGEVAGVPVTIVDPRETLSEAASAAGARSLCLDPAEAFRAAGLGPGDAVAVLAHDDRLDLSALRAALDRQPGYIGLLGGRRTQASRRDSLREAGCDPEAVEGIRGPIGIDIGAESPSEIAVSVLAEVIAHWNRTADPVG